MTGTRGNGPSDAPPASGWKLSWETVLAGVGAAAALGLWINVVGGAVLWARFDSAGLPASDVVGVVPNSTLLAVGIRALLLPLLVGIVAVALLYVARPARDEAARKRPHAPPGLRRRKQAKPPLKAQFVALGKAIVRALRGARRPAEPPDAATVVPGIGAVLLALGLMGFITAALLFGAEVHAPEHPEWVYTWAIASAFLVFAAVTYRPVGDALRDEWRGAALIVMAAAGFLVIWGIGVAVGHGWPAAVVALIALVAAVLAYFVPPDETLFGISAGILVILVYLVLGAVLYFWPGGGSITFDAGAEPLSLVIALVASSLALLFVGAASRRVGSFGAMAAIMFAVVAAWGGVVSYLRERASEPAFDLTAMVRKPTTGLDGDPAARAPIAGYLIARTADTVLVARGTAVFDTAEWRIDVVPRDQIEAMVVGPSCIVDPAELRIAHQLSEELQMDQRDLTGDTDVRTVGPAGSDVNDCATPAG